MTELLIFFFGCCGIFMLGVWYGKSAEARRWRNTAEDAYSHPIESNGVLYEVKRESKPMAFGSLDEDNSDE